MDTKYIVQEDIPMSKSKQVLSQFESHIHKEYLSLLRMSPMESLTPVEVENLLNGKSEFLFLAKCSPYVYAPVKGRDIERKTDIKFTMYNEDDNLIIRFDILDMMLESAIPAHKIKEFLSILLHQEYITVAVLDGNAYRLIWMTNQIPFRTIRFHYKEVFERYGVI